MIWTAIMAALSKIPLKVIAVTVAIAALVGLGFLWGRSGPTKEFAAYKAEQDLRVAVLSKKAAEVTTKVVTDYVEVVRYVEVAGKTITKKVNVYVPRNVCILPGSFRRLHDASATGSELPDSPGDADAATVDAQDVAATVTDNYTISRLNAEQLIALQNWVREQQQAHDGNR